MKSPSIPLVYACSGCPNVGQMANHFAVQLDQGRLAEMSCTTGVGGGVLAPTRIAQSGRPILALDGCALSCAKACLARAGVEPTVHLVLDQMGVRHDPLSDDRRSSTEMGWPAVVEAAVSLRGGGAKSAA